MSKDEIKNRFKETKLGKKINKRFKKTLIIFLVSHLLMLISLILLVPNINNIISGKSIGIIFGISLLLSSIISFVFSTLLVYYDQKHKKICFF